VSAIDEGVAVTIADVSGKGISAAIMASLLQGMIHEGLTSRALPISLAASQVFCERELVLQVRDAGDRPRATGGELEYLELRSCAAADWHFEEACRAAARIRSSPRLLPHAQYERASQDCGRPIVSSL